jgi:hypothetical protein
MRRSLRFLTCSMALLVLGSADDGRALNGTPFTLGNNSERGWGHPRQ